MDEARTIKKLTAGILAHVDAGKTTLAEALLFRAGVLRKLGRVDHRDTFLDTHALERERGITIFSKHARLRTNELELTLLDTPGHGDLSGETERAVAAMDVGILVVSGTDGVQAHTETLWSLLRRGRVPTFIFVTKMDAARQSRAELLSDLRACFGEGCVPFPVEDEEALAMLDDGALEAYMGSGHVPDEEIVRLIQTRKLFPVCFGSGLRLEGVDEFLALLTKYAPEPVWPAIFGARVYKIGRDPQAGRLTYLKLTGGTLSVRDTLRYGGADGEVVEEKAAQLRLYSGQKFETVQTVSAGDVVAVTGLTKTRPGQELLFGDGELRATVEAVAEGGNRIVQFHYEGIFLEVLERLGKMPLPPYIKAELADSERYQTVYSREPGSAAAPTAGLHFTEALLEQIRAKGVKVCFVTLHVGLGTFRPVKEEEIEDHPMHAEFCIVPEKTARIINETKAAGGRVVAVGTTSCRTLESFAKQDGTLEPSSGWTDIFIYPGYRFKCIDALVTNFHLPESTLIMLVSALAGRENILNAYAVAVRERYRFFSFGDAMMIE